MSEDDDDEAPDDGEDMEAHAVDVTEDDAGLDVLAVLAGCFPDVPTASLRALVRDGGVTLDERRCGPGQGVSPGQRLLVSLDVDRERIAPAPLEGFAVLHAEADVLACQKPAGVAVESERGDDARPFKAAILHHLSRAALEGEPIPRPRVAHRLDKDTTGVVLVALTRRGLQALTRQLEAREVEKEYLALVAGRVADDAGLIDRPLQDTSVAAGARGAPVFVEARTRWEVAERFAAHTLVRCFPETGRQHQLRRHLTAIGHPIVADALHGGGGPLLLSQLKRGYRPPRSGEERPLLARLGLHARRVTFASPASGAPVTVEAPLPDDLEVALRQLRRWGQR